MSDDILANVAQLVNQSSEQLILHMENGMPFSGFNSSLPDHVERFLLMNLGQKRKDLGSVIVLTIVYGFIFLSGVVGNVCTCVVITKNAYMHTVTNYYLVNLALADILTLFFALPPELYTVWEAYPWRLGETFCLIKSFLSEMTYNTSVLTITAFTVERYIAICYPVKGRSLSTLSRALVVIFCTWIVACICALPYPFCTRVFYYIKYPDTQKPVLESLLCNIPRKWQDDMRYVFEISTFVFFVTPMVVITVMYILIGLKIRSSEPIIDDVRAMPQVKSAASKARRAVVKMLVAVVVAFFVCWAPFHSQRLMTLYIKEWNEELLAVQSHVFYISGVLYFFSSTVNPILYNLLSRKFRQAFKRTLCRRCCVNIDGLPAFYRLRAKFVLQRHDKPSTGIEYHRRDKAILLASFNNNNEARKRGKAYSQNDMWRARISSNDAYLLRKSTKQDTSCVTSSAHAHSDGRLQHQCRHRYCSSRANVRTQNHRRIVETTSLSYNNIYCRIPCDITSDHRPCSESEHCSVTRQAKEYQRSLLLLPECDGNSKCRKWRFDNSRSSDEPYISEQI